MYYHCLPHLEKTETLVIKPCMIDSY